MDRYEKIWRCDFIGKEGLEKLRNARVLICGAGGVGTNLVQNVAAIGVGHIGLIDNDIVEAKNLSIQILYNEQSIGKYKVDECKKWVNNFDSSIDIKTWNVRLDEKNGDEIFKDYDIILDAFDTAKSVVLMNELAVKNNKILIHAGTIEDSGNVWTTIPHKTPCAHCFKNFEEHEKWEPHSYGVLQPVGAIVASLQTFELVKLVLNKGALIARAPLNMHYMYNIFERPNLFVSKTEKCPLCGLPRISYEPFKENCIN